MFSPTKPNLLLITRWRTNGVVAEWSSIDASILGPGSTGTGTKYLADDMTWKTVTGGSGNGYFLDFGDRFSTNPGTFIDLGDRFA
jgi:hypothetical protein